MMKPDQQKLRILVILLIILGLTLFVGYRLNRTPNPAVVQAENQKPAVALPAQTDARIRMDILEKESADGDVGKKNLFQYGPPPAPPAPPASANSTRNAANGQNQQSVNAASNSAASTNISRTPPPPPPIPLKYIGVSSVENSKDRIATLIDDTQHHFNAAEGDVFMGRYKISHITETSVDVDDLQASRRQTLPLVKQ